jgi:hypothetical protein
MTELELKAFERLCRSKVDVTWTKADVLKLLDEVKRLRGELDRVRTSAWSGLRFVGGH